MKKFTLYYEDIDRHNCEVQGDTVQELIRELEEATEDGDYSLGAGAPCLARGFAVELTKGKVNPFKKEMEKEIEDFF